MWLINCRTLTLEEVVSPQATKYAILSHTWENGEEVPFGEFRKKEGTTKRGWRKISKTCELALEDGYEFAWCDTCCIDKTSSAELAEAINSMFLWYAQSEVCYAYLADYDAPGDDTSMSSSVWFTRGWTLQELIAPPRVRFYDKSWNAVGTKATLSRRLSLITGIGEDVLLAAEHQSLEALLAQVPVGRKMAWASKRETTRTEDMAYCLLGIFRVNLPMLYGEGEHAFIRLQEEIVKSTNDLSLFAWRSSEEDGYCGVLARHPRDFQHSDNIALTDNIIYSPDFATTNKGIKIETNLRYNATSDLYMLDINCHNASRPNETLAIYLKHQGASVFARARPSTFAGPYGAAVVGQRSFFLSKRLQPGTAESLHKLHRCAFVMPSINPPYNEHWMAGMARPEVLWDSGRRMFITAGLQDFVGCCEFIYDKSSNPYPDQRHILSERFFVLFGYGYDYGSTPWARIVMSYDRAAIEAIGRDSLRRAAYLALSKDLPRREVKYTGLYREYIKVRLEPGIEDGEPVYVVKCHIEE